MKNIFKRLFTDNNISKQERSTLKERKIKYAEIHLRLAFACGAIAGAKKSQDIDTDFDNFMNEQKFYL